MDVPEYFTEVLRGWCEFWGGQINHSRLDHGGDETYALRYDLSTGVFSRPLNMSGTNYVVKCTKPTAYWLQSIPQPACVIFYKIKWQFLFVATVCFDHGGSYSPKSMDDIQGYRCWKKPWTAAALF